MSPLMERLLAVMPVESPIDREQQAAAIAAEVARAATVRRGVFRRAQDGLGAAE